MENTKKRNIPSNLPEVEFVDTNTEALVNKLIAGYEGITGRTLYPADPVRAFILWIASVYIFLFRCVYDVPHATLPFRVFL